MIQTKLLEVGDKVYSTYLGKVRDLHTIDRVTKTLAISGGMRFRRDYDFRIYVSGEHFSTCDYKIETPELAKEYFLLQFSRKLAKTDFSKFSEEKMTAIMNLIENNQ